MLDNEQIVADLKNGEWAYYYSMGRSSEEIREINREASGKLVMRLPNGAVIPLTKDEPEILLGKVPTSLELTCLTDDKLKERLRLTAQILVAEVGADGPMNAEDVALKVVELIKGLRDEIKTVRKAAQALEAQRDDYAARYEFMVKRSCDERLDGYRELGHKCAQLEEERDKALAEVKSLNSLLAANRLLTRAAIHNMFLSSDPGAQIAKIIEEQEKKDELETVQKAYQASKAEVVRLEIESGHWIVRSMDLEKDVERLRERLQFDPGGSDKIDELEQALQFTRHEVDVLKVELERLRAEPTAAQEREAIVTWLRSEPIYRNRPWAVISADIERGEHWPKDKGTL